MQRSEVVLAKAKLGDEALASQDSGDGQAHLGKVAVALSPQERFDEYLQTKGLRNTDQRRMLVEQVFSRHEHFDADQLIEQLPRKGHPGYVSRPTVYRTLKELVEAGLLRSFQLDGRSVYEHDYGYPQHDHFYCTRCRQLFEFRSEALLELRDQVSAQHNFRVASHRLIIQGVCETCARARRQRRKQDLV
jgi:Fur family transcriptional regulator, ferric uptake regulator